MRHADTIAALFYQIFFCGHIPFPVSVPVKANLKPLAVPGLQFPCFLKSGQLFSRNCISIAGVQGSKIDLDNILPGIVPAVGYRQGHGNMILLIHHTDIAVHKLCVGEAIAEGIEHILRIIVHISQMRFLRTGVFHIHCIFGINPIPFG